ncbi:cbb3-type cytochrome oxidase assembly protein CcoS [Rhodanobacter denitrificans]|uniref:Cbb3-type cytochrome oxidase assembly protein CcoS n=1 Tax=Rhodanobacter denitrificans TaxID=666685 RepID=A0A368KFV7_9GAMM|nr:cbb3-type cytochrome oxidase assembly protein CcoS [Rhodanobacter denitrificans]RCS30791.1 cbb3-type cytochrome oxidase assembly protein CcoS [Rhodanobacter denitrificans]
MNILLVLIPVTTLIVGVGVWLFFWAVNHQQFDDLDSPAVLPLMDDPATDPMAERAAPLDPPAPPDATPPAAGDAADDRPV